MNPNPVVLIVTSTFGDGHVKVAEAIEHSFRSRGIDQVHTVDLFAEVHPKLNELSRKFYLNSAVYAQGLYGLLYEMTSGMKPRRALGRLLHSMGKRKVQKILDDMRPDVIIHTFPYLAAAELGEETVSGVPIFTVMTDYVLHGRWLHPHTMKYFIATEGMRQALLSEGIAEDAVVVSGIPIRQAFETYQDRELLLKKHGLCGDRRYILLAAGAYGVMSHTSKLIETVIAKSDFDLIVLCGNNHKLRKAMEELYQENSRVHLLGYTEEMQELMCISSCLLSKAGGITLTEAIAQSLPVIVYRPLPGQEAGNAEWLSRQKVIDTAHNEEQLIDQLRQLEKPLYRRERIRRMKAFSRKSSAEHIVSEILNAVERRQPFAGQAKPKIVEGQVKTIHGYL
ncbi:MGDG synthase family glycosyltransferase [Paenibacillus sp. URB8-2]|uniref:MGDG synthase family glycosyltransferase n=1 Tax=Paenibacillus sp. URB8-2 TaxID=2741301 RepID=UPI0015BE4EA4|nr:UDP-N-acetylglucosamine 2-epimerase [Paenibacillus sp. URB8-2]BCG59325.1 processive diacylglycerol beta-glucosyltransferase [Paenibacillus sp. URB8-2]